MKSINRSTLLGHIVADLELKSTKSGKAVTAFAIATNNEWFDAEGELKKSTDFHRIVAWDHLAELCGKFLRKGSPVYLEGRLTNRSYEGKDGITRYITEVVANHVTLLEVAANRNTLEPKTFETQQSQAQEERELVAA